MKKLIIQESIEDLRHIKNWQDIKNVFGNAVQRYPGVTKDSKQGEYGRLWKIKNMDLSLKITTDSSEMQIARKLKGKQTKGFLEIYEIVEIDKHIYDNRTIPKLQLRIQELCYPIPELIKISKRSSFQTAMDLLRGNFEEFKVQKIRTEKDLNVFFTNLKSLESENLVIRNLANNKELQKLISPFLAEFLDLLYRVHEDLPNLDVAEDIDVHEGNIMQDKQGVWKLVDF